MSNYSTEHMNPMAEAVADDEIDFFALWQTLVEAKWLILTITLVCTALATTAAFVMTKKYKAEVVLTVADDAKGKSGLGGLASQFGGLADMAGVTVAGGNSAELMVAVLKSKRLLSDFVTENNLMPILFAKKWDGQAKKWAVDDPEEIPTLNDAIKLIEKKIMVVNADKKTGLITLTMEWKNAQQATDWANDLVKRANKIERDRSIKEAETSTAYLTEELKKTSVVEVQQAIYRLIEAQVKSVMLANTREQFALKVLDPAIAVDEKDFVTPKRGLIIAISAIAGLLFGSLIAFIRAALRKRSAA